MGGSLRNVSAALVLQSLNTYRFACIVSIPERDFSGYQRVQASIQHEAHIHVSIPERDFSGYQRGGGSNGKENYLVSIPERDFSGYQHKDFRRTGDKLEFQSLKGILVDINPQGFGRSYGRGFQSLKGILVDINSSPSPVIHVLTVSIPERDFSGYQRDRRARLKRHPGVSIPERDFSGYQPTTDAYPLPSVVFQSLKGILVDINLAAIPHCHPRCSFQSLKGILVDINPLVQCGSVSGYRVSIPERDFSGYQPAILFP